MWKEAGWRDRRPDNRQEMKKTDLKRGGCKGKGRQKAYVQSQPVLLLARFAFALKEARGVGEFFDE